MTGLRAVLGVLLGLVARLWLATLRLRVEVAPELAAIDPARPQVLVFFHGTQWPLLAWKRRRRTAVMVSHSMDGAMQARALRLLGFEVVRGSSSRGGARGLAAIVRRLRRGHDAAFAVDGPRGPYGTAKAGALLAANACGGVLVPMGAAVRRGKVFDRAWDRFVLAWPFSEVVVVLGAPLDVPAPAATRAASTVPSSSAAVAAAIVAANRRAADVLREMATPGSEVVGYVGISADSAPAAAERGG